MDDREAVQKFMDELDELASHYDFRILKSNFTFKFGMKIYDVIKDENECMMT